VRWKARPGGREELLLLVHEQEVNGPLLLFYTHRFLTLDPLTLEPRRLSQRWVLHGRRIEYVIGLELDSSICCGCANPEEDNAIMLGYSIMDSESWISRVCSSTVDEMLKTRKDNPELWLGA
jgi:hypothetical protein